WGLSAIDVAKVCFVTGLTFWLGNACVLGLSVVIDPHAASAVDQLPPHVNRALATTSLAVVGLYLAWLWPEPRTIGVNNWKLTLPGPGLTLIQIAIGALDLGLSALAMFLLMPDEPRIEFMTFVVIFVAATLLGFLSHAPSGLGVFDAMMLVALDQFSAEKIVASVLLFRFVYYIVPLLIALTLFGGRELLLACIRWSRSQKERVI